MKYTVKKIRDILEKKHAPSVKPGRALYIHKSHCDYGQVGAVFFALNGSPPKGYAIFRQGSGESGLLFFYDVWGRKFKPHIGGSRESTENNDVITDINNFKDDDILPESI